MKFGEKLFQAKLLSRLSHKVYRLLSSPVLLRKFTILSFIETHRNKEQSEKDSKLNRFLDIKVVIMAKIAL